MKIIHLLTGKLVAFLYIFSAVMIFIFMICSLRTNIPFFMIFLLLGLFNVLLAYADWEAAKGHIDVSQNLQVVSLFTFSSS